MGIVVNFGGATDTRVAMKMFGYDLSYYLLKLQTVSIVFHGHVDS